MTPTAREKPQTTPLHGPNLILDVENFGPIAEAKNIEFKPMTVFVGPSNTGKTYLASMLHIWLNSVDTDPTLGAAASSRSGSHQEILDTADLEIFRSELLDIVGGLTFLEAHTQLREIYYYTFEVKNFSEQFRIVLQNFISRHFDVARFLFKDKIYDHFSVNLNPDSHPDQTDYTAPCITIRNNINSFNMDLVNQDTSYDLAQFSITMDVIEAVKSNTEAHDNDSGQPDEVINLFFDNFIGFVLEQFRSSFYLPTGRTGIMNSRHILASELVARSQDYNSISRDFLSLIVRIRSNPIRPIFRSPEFYPRTNSFASNVKLDAVAHTIERSVLEGRIVVKETTGLSEFYFQKQDNSVPMDIASSMVTDLAPIVLFLRNFVQVGDLLIIDEPEAHLHPEAQQQMAAALAFMVRSGLRVLITTHSHYMVEQLSAFVNASKLDEPTRKRALSLGGALGEEDIYLNEDETAVYSFKMSPEHGGSVVEEIFMGEEFEYGPDDHSDATTDQFNRLQRVLEAREALEFDDLD